MSAPWPVGLFLVIAGGWLARVCWRGSETQWGRLTVNWPIPWPQMHEASRRRLRLCGAAVGLAVMLGGLALLLLS
ncbi:MAG: hypothetical protein HUU35_01030 [Armatimonadetes bacterium]|nr:hypothetical protein [Armatimonadota bacterium]